MNSIGIYVHFPFCVSKCKYCDFVSYTDKNNLQREYLQALINEINSYKDSKIIVDTIYIGGGTPSFMFDGCISTLISEIRKMFVVDIDAEISIECNPNSVTLKKAREWKEAGVNRVSIGLQTTSARLLKLIGRTHSKNDYLKAINIIKDAGITNINTDCLIGLPRQKLSHVKHTLNTIVKQNCTHVSVYSLILEDNTPLFDMVHSGELKLPKEEKSIGMFNYTLKFLTENGYDRYEVSNFAKRGFECKHNNNTWAMHEYLGFGAAAHGYFQGYRYNNFRQIEDYIKGINTNKTAVESKEKITNTQMFEETIMLGLRTKKGIDLDEIKQNFKVDLLKSKKDLINELLSQGYLNLVYNRINLTNSGFEILNKIILDLVS